MRETSRLVILALVTVLTSTKQTSETKISLLGLCPTGPCRCSHEGREAENLCLSGSTCGRAGGHLFCSPLISVGDTCKGNHCFCSDSPKVLSSNAVLCKTHSVCKMDTDGSLFCLPHIEEGQPCKGTRGCHCKSRRDGKAVGLIRPGVLCDLNVDYVVSLLEDKAISAEKMSLCSVAFEKYGAVSLTSYYAEVSMGQVCGPNDAPDFEKKGFGKTTLFEIGQVVSEDGAGCVGFDSKRFGFKAIRCNRGELCGSDFEQPVCVTPTSDHKEEVIPVAKDEGLFRAVVASWAPAKVDWALCAEGQTMVVKTDRVYCKGTDKALRIRPGQVCPNVGKGRCNCHANEEASKKCFTGETCAVASGKPECVPGHSLWFCGGEDACACDGTFKAPTYFCERGKLWGANFHSVPKDLTDPKVAGKEQLVRYYWRIYWESHQKLEYDSARRHLMGVGGMTISQSAKSYV